ncbi:cystathionine beta-synthase (beta-thionase), putative [Talaromyces stipitatus ATCC 10500]|uniref:Cystathionine beta-synthase (Beta-thionase), putative n=1 Tax=Talaromyces stipitatus (strain ATCC 10500 / CBS 375.48 / QM 6759 / NRRL 1006) TaxID=441959 RepID=B8MSK8_TALSN|nr:cystathionine beta-synthase (beta-thionase), putative [Talaromyces stipitatus ATCC 10500]EED12336.1 cystathionine beta-synthase (beta-thionase), putative [Talaromyces stipitatus ATCC 10500]
MATYSSVGETLARENLTDHASAASTQNLNSWSGKYRGATVEDLDPPPALSVSPNDSISSALLTAYERDYSHLTVISSSSRALLGYLSIPRLKTLLREGKVSESDPVKAAMQRFNRKKSNIYTVITMDTPLEELERFFKGEPMNPTEGRPTTGMGKQDFAIVTDPTRKFVLGVVTEGDLQEFVRRRP